MTSSAGVTCFFCNEIGHYASRCPKKQQVFAPVRSEQGVSAQGSASSVKPATKVIKGRVTHVTAKETHDAPDVVLGTFPVNSVPASV